MNVTQLLSFLPDAKKNGTGWQARCPSHDDRSPSLSISEGADGRVLLNCFAGCSTESVCAALSITIADLFPDKPAHNGHNNGRAVAPIQTKPAFDWQKCVSDFGDGDAEKIGAWREIAPAFFKWLQANQLIGLFDGQVAFPNHDSTGSVVSCHVRLESGNWIFKPSGQKTAPLIIGDAKTAGFVFIFESQWDCFAVMDKLGANTGDGLPDCAFVITRGASNGKLIRGLLSPDTNAYAFKQNDSAADKWLNDVAANAGCTVLNVATPAPHKDCNDWLKAGAGKSEIEAAMKAGKIVTVQAVTKPEESDIPVREKSDIASDDCVILPGGSGTVTITEAATNLFKRVAPKRKLFMRGKVVVSAQRGMTGTLVLEPVRPSAARSLFEGYAQFLAWRAGKTGAPVLKPSIIPEETARAFLDCQAATEMLPTITGIVNCPVIVETSDGLKVCPRGFSEETGLLIVQGDRPHDVPLAEAVESLLGLLSEFHFQSEGDKSRAVASLITPGLRMGNLIRCHVPADVAEADKSQSGKTYRQKVNAAIYGERPALVPLKTRGVGGVDESLFEKLVNGRPFVQFDNYRGALDSPVLEAFLTAEGSFPCRIPGLREIEVDPSRFFILLTSNGVETTRDFANRSSIIRIFKRDGVQFRDSLGDVIKRQPYFLGCVFAVIREWHRQGKPRTTETGHDFREWCQVLDWIVQNVFGLAPLVTGHLAAQERVSNPVLTFLRRLSLEVAKEDLLDVPLIASRLFEIADAAEIPIPGLRPADIHDGEKARKIIGTKLATIFKASDAVDLDGFTITRGEESHQRGDGQGFTALKVYTFSTSTTPTTATPTTHRKTVPFF